MVPGHMKGRAGSSIGFFNILDWDKNLIGEKLISISKNNIKLSIHLFFSLNSNIPKKE